MADQADWQRLASSLRDLHRALMERARRDYEREHPVVLNPAQFLQLLATDPYFEWLRGLSELMVDIDVVRDSGSQLMDELSSAVRAAVEHFVAAPNESEPGNTFALRYWPYVQEDPHVAMSHAGVKQALMVWPSPIQQDAASLLHARHLLTEKARHRTRGG
jgi:hypothetical protein